MRSAIAVIGTGAALLAALLGVHACKSEDDSHAKPNSSLSEAGKPDGPGWGGQPGAGGTGGVGSDAAPDAVVLPDSGLAAQHAWLDDPAIWKLVPGTEFVQPKCYVFEGDSTKLKFPALTWKSCGTGCEVMDMNQGFDKNGVGSGASTHRIGGKARALLATSVVENTPDWTYGAQEVVDLESGQPIGARLLRIRTNNGFSACEFGWPKYSVAHGLSGGASSLQADDSKRMPVSFDVESQGWIWGQPAQLTKSVSTGLDTFYLDHNHMQFQTGFGAVYALTNPKLHKWDVLEANSTSYLGEGEGDLAVWIDSLVAGKQKLKGWAPDGKGVRVLRASLPATTCLVVPTPTAIVGWVSDAPCDQRAKPRLFKLPRLYTDTGQVPELGPLLGQNIATDELKSWGDYAAANVGEMLGNELVGYVLIVRLSDWKHWRLDASPGLATHIKSWTLADDHIYVGEGGSKANEITVNKQVRRLKLSVIDSWAKAL